MTKVVIAFKGEDAEDAVNSILETINDFTSWAEDAFDVTTDIKVI